MLQYLKLTRPLAFLDLETTGLDVETARIVEWSLTVVTVSGSASGNTQSINPGIPIPPEATAVHGITDADVAERPTFGELALAFIETLGRCDLAGFNLRRYDLPVLMYEFARANVPFSIAGRRIVDVCEIFHARERRDLRAAVKFYLNRDHDDAHGAAADVAATVDVLDAQLAHYDDLPRTVDELADAFTDPAAGRRRRWSSSTTCLPRCAALACDLATMM